MMDPTQPGGQADTSARSPVIRAFGLGQAGGHVIEAVHASGFPAIDLLVANTDLAELSRNALAHRIQLGARLTRGLGTGGDPVLGCAVAQDELAQLEGLCQGADLVFVVAGLGGGTGSGVAPALARVARECGALAIGLVTLPFECEGQRRVAQAQEALAALQDAADGVVQFPYQELVNLVDESNSLVDTLRVAHELGAEGVKGICRMVSQRGLLNVGLPQLRAFFGEHFSNGRFGAATGSGANRSQAVVDQVLADPMLGGARTLSHSDALIVSIAGGPDLTIGEVHQVSDAIYRVSRGAKVLVGAAVDEQMEDRLSVSVVVSRPSSPPTPNLDNARTAAFGDRPSPASPAGLRTGGASLPSESDGLTAAFPRSGASGTYGGSPRTGGTRGQPSMTNHPSGKRAVKKDLKRLRQGVLPLEMVSRGRFEKSEPTIHHGEDLDVPTYVRRGVALN